MYKTGFDRADSANANSRRLDCTTLSFNVAKDVVCARSKPSDMTPTMYDNRFIRALESSPDRFASNCASFNSSESISNIGLKISFVASLGDAINTEETKMPNSRVADGKVFVKMNLAILRMASLRDSSGKRIKSVRNMGVNMQFAFIRNEADCSEDSPTPPELPLWLFEDASGCACSSTAKTRSKTSNVQSDQTTGSCGTQFSSPGSIKLDTEESKIV